MYCIQAYFCHVFSFFLLKVHLLKDLPHFEFVKTQIEFTLQLLSRFTLKNQIWLRTHPNPLSCQSNSLLECRILITSLYPELYDALLWFSVHMHQRPGTLLCYNSHHTPHTTRSPGLRECQFSSFCYWPLACFHWCYPEVQGIPSRNKFHCFMEC